MTQASTNPKQNIDANEAALIPPDTLSSDEKWIVRIHGKDIGPFSSKQLYPRLLQGEVEPETLLLDQERFTRCRLQEVPEFQPYLHLHNTQNPILLEEQRRQERDRHWEEKGKKRAILGSVAAVLVVALSITAFFVLRKGDDAVLTDGDHVFNLGGSFQGMEKEKKKRNWEEEERKRLAALRRAGGGKRAKGGAAAGGGSSAQTIDFDSEGGGSAVPREQLQRIIAQRIRGALHCFKSQMERESRFEGCSVEFTVNGTEGRITNVELKDTDYASAILKKCVQRSASGWSFPKFPSSVIVSFPVRIAKRTRM